MPHLVSRRHFTSIAISAILFALGFPLMIHFVAGGELFGAFMVIPLTLIAWNFKQGAGLVAALVGIVFTELLFNVEFFFIRHLSISPYWAMIAIAPALVFLFVGISIGRLGETHRELQRTIESKNQLEQKLISAQTSARHYLDIAGVLLMVLDRDGRITLMNKKGHEVLGYEEGELIGRDFISTCLPERVRKEMAAAHKRLLSGEPASENYENPVLKKNGEERLVAWHNTLLRDQSGMLVASLSSGEDVTERRKTEEAFSRSHAHLQAVMNALPDMMFELDRQGAIYDVRASRPDRLFYPQVLSPISNRIQDLVPADTAEKILSSIAQAGRSGEYKSPPLGFENGKETRWFELSVAAVGNYLEKDCHFVVLARNTTERKRLEQQLIQSQKMEAVGRLSGGIAHDFNNILMVIISYCDLMLRGLGDEEQTRSWVKIVKDSAERAASLTHQLLAFSRKQLLAPITVDVDRLVEDMRSMLMKLLGENIAFNHHSTGNLNKVKADASQLQQVIMNLTVNARDAMPDQGELTIEVNGIELPADDANPPTEMYPGKYVLIQVRDTGSGMDADTMSHLFEPFFTTKELGRGTGLGLSIVYGIVKQSDGYVYVDSKLGTGTTFRIYLPRIEEAGEVHGSGPEEDHRGKETVLLVEDEEDVRGLIARHLAGCGYKVLEAANGARALELCQEDKGGIHLLVTDIGLPGLKGWKVAEAFKAANPSGRIIYMTGYTDEVALKEIGADEKTEILQKPFSMIDLAARIRRLLDETEKKIV